MFREYLAQADRRVRATKTHIYNQERLIESSVKNTASGQFELGC